MTAELPTIEGGDGISRRAVVTARRTTHRGSGPTQHRRVALRVGWGVADQGISSLGNLVLGVLVARALSPHDFGAYAVAFTTFGFILSANRGPSTDPLLVRHSGPRTAEWRRAVSACTGCALTIGIASGIGCLLVGLALPGQLEAGFVALGIGMPGILLQDSWRFAFFSSGQAHLAFASDLLSGLLQTGGLLTLVAFHELTVFSAILVFGLTTGLAGLASVAVGRIVPNLLLVRSWLVQTRSLGTRYLVENLSLGTFRQLRMATIGLIAGLAAVGAIRGAEILTGPLMMLNAGVSQVAVPEAKQVLDRSPHRLERFCLALAAPQIAVTALWAVVAFAFVPRGLGHLLLGDSWKAAAQLLPPMMVVTVTTIFANGAIAGVRALGASRRSMATQLCNTTVMFALSTLGAVATGTALGSYWGFAAAGVFGTTCWWWQLRQAVAGHLATHGRPGVGVGRALGVDLGVEGGER